VNASFVGYQGRSPWLVSKGAAVYVACGIAPYIMRSTRFTHIAAGESGARGNDLLCGNQTISPPRFVLIVLNIGDEISAKTLI
jgi:hypothetical protein